VIVGPDAPALRDEQTAGDGEAETRSERVPHAFEATIEPVEQPGPLQGDQGKVHAQNISRGSIAAGLPCSTCHQEKNSDAIGVLGGPPGAPRWGLPPPEHPMVFQGKTPTALCEQLKNPAHNGGKSLAQLLEHVSHDALVLWGWNPGGKRQPPPLPHDKFVAAFTTWVASNGACP